MEERLRTQDPAWERAWEAREALEARQSAARFEDQFRLWVQHRWLISALAAILMYVWSMIGSDWFPRANAHEIGHQLMAILTFSDPRLLATWQAVTLGHTVFQGWSSPLGHCLVNAGGVIGELLLVLLLVALPLASLRGAGAGLFLAVLYGVCLDTGPYRGDLFVKTLELAHGIAIACTLATLPVVILLLLRDRHRQSAWNRRLVEADSAAGRVSRTVAEVRRQLALRGFYDSQAKPAPESVRRIRARRRAVKLTRQHQPRK